MSVAPGAVAGINSGLNTTNKLPPKGCMWKYVVLVGIVIAACWISVEPC